MDAHFKSAPLEKNMPVIMALIGECLCSCASKHFKDLPKNAPVIAMLLGSSLEPAWVGINVAWWLAKTRARAVWFGISRPVCN